jgi:hypothetical protein
MISARGRGRPGRRVGVGDNDRAAPIEVIVDADAHLGVEWNGLVVDSQQATPDRIKAVSDVGEANRFGLLQERREGMRQDLVRAVADKYLLGRYFVIGGERLAQAGRFRVGVETQRIRGLGAHGLYGFG